jgi:hypothetical protein
MLFQLTQNWPQFLGAVILLFTPLPLFFGKGVEFRELGRPWHHVWRGALLLPWHWIDFLRLVAGAWLLKAAIGLAFAPEAIPEQHPMLALAACILMVGMVAQALSAPEEGTFFVPFTYVFAATAVFFPPLLATLVLIPAITATIGFRSLAAFLWSLPICLGALGVWLYPNWLWLAVGVTLSMGAALLPLLFSRDFVFAHRALPADAEALRPLR